MVAANAHCYRAQSYATTRALATALGLHADGWSVAFQSRLGRTPWIKPWTDERLPELARAGVKRLAVLCPSFAADCLETLEEIGIRARKQWQDVGGESLELVPCANAHPAFVAFLAARIRARGRGD
jgi:ferrochelatase